VETLPLLETFLYFEARIQSWFLFSLSAFICTKLITMMPALFGIHTSADLKQSASVNHVFIDFFWAFGRLPLAPFAIHFIPLKS